MNTADQFVKALRAKYRTPGNALQALSLDENLLDPEPEAKRAGISYLDALLDLKAKMSREGFRALLEVLLADESAEDEISDLSGLPKNGIQRGSMAADSATLAECQRLAPGFEQIKVDGANMGTVYRGPRYDTRGTERGAEIVPGFDRIKVGAL